MVSCRMMHCEVRKAVAVPGAKASTTPRELPFEGHAFFFAYLATQYIVLAPWTLSKLAKFRSAALDLLAAVRIVWKAPVQEALAARGPSHAGKFYNIPPSQHMVTFWAPGTFPSTDQLDSDVGATDASRSVFVA